MAIAWVFPGQGSQKAGMAEGVLALPGAGERFGRASVLLGRDLLPICAGAETAHREYITTSISPTATCTPAH